MERELLLGQITDALGPRKLVWSGLRGDDIEPIVDVPQLTSAFSMIGRYSNRSSLDAVAFEDLAGTRPDMEVWDVDDHLKTDEAVEFRRAHLRALAQDSALMTYRPSRFLSAIWFARRNGCLNLGLFGGHQAAFEHKPWVESSLAELGIAHIPWTYVADEEQLDAERHLANGPVVLRRSRTSGGAGIVLVHDHAELAAAWPEAEEAFVSVAPYLEGLLPLNVGATVWRDGVTVHHPSVQLIGIDSCVTRPFGYCGNDFGLMRSIDPAIHRRIEEVTRQIGGWLRSFGYLGTFGVDYLLDGDELLFTEVNPRFQGSTQSSCRLSVEEGEGCLMLEHLGAMLGLAAPTARPLADRVAEMSDLAHAVVHWTGSLPAHLDPAGLTDSVPTAGQIAGADVRTRPELLTDPGGTVARLTVRGSLTTTGFDLVSPWSDRVDQWLATTPRATTDPPRHDGA